MSGIFPKLDDNRDLPFGQVQLGQGCVVIAQRGHAQGVADGSAGHPQIGGLGKVGAHGDLGAHQAGRRGNGAQALNGAQVALHRHRSGLQRLRVFAGEHEHIFLSRASQTHLGAHTGQGLQSRADVVFNRLLAWARATFGQLDGERGLAHLGRTAADKRVRACTATANRGVNAFHVFDRHQQLAGVFGAFLGLRQSGPWRQLHIDLGLGVVIGRDEALGQQGHQHDRADEKQRGQHHGDQTVLHAPCGPHHVALEPSRFVRKRDHWLQNVSGHHGREHPCDHQGSKHSQRSRPAKLLEELARNTAHKGRGQKHRNQGECGGDHSQADLVGGLHGRLVGRLAHAQMAHDVFHLHNRIIDQHADHQRQRQQCHHVDGKAQIGHANECRNDRQRQRHSRDKGRPPIAQKQPHHQHRQNSAFVQQHHGAAVFLFDRGHEIKGLSDVDVGVLQAVIRQRLAHQAAHGHFALAFAAHHFKTHHGLAVQAGRRTRIGQGVTDRGDLVQAHTPTLRGGQLDLAKLLRRLDRGQCAHGLLACTQFHAPARAFLLHQLELARNLGGAQTHRLQAVHIEGDAHLSRHTAHPVDRPHAAQGQEFAGDVFVDQPRQRFVVHAR